MSIKNFITDILNIDYDQIEKIDSLYQPDNSLVVHLTLKKASNPTCPHCNSPLISNGFYKRKLTHSTLVNRNCTLVFHRRRYFCKNCGISFSEPNPFSSFSESVTYETKINVLKDLKSPKNTYSSVAARFNLSKTQVIRIFDKHVSIPRKTLPEVLSIDEHYFPQSNFDSLYICILMDFNTGTIIDVLPDRKKNYLSYYFGAIYRSTLNDRTHMSELDNVRYVSIDLYEVYRSLSRTYFPHALVCADSFHVLEHLTDDFKAVRLRCLRSSEDPVMHYLLVKFKWLFNHNVELDNKGKYNRRLRRVVNYRDIVNILFERFPDLKKAYDLKEKYIYFNSTANVSDASERLSSLISDFASCGLEEYIEFYNLLINWNREIINSFSIVDSRRINNSYIESRNRTIETLLYNANGFTNFERTRNRILYCLNPLDSFKL